MQIYLKAPAKKLVQKPKKTMGIASILFLVVGLGLILQAVWPVAGWYLFSLPVIGTDIVSPIWAAENKSYEPAEWFSNLPKDLTTVGSVLKSYTITIPKLKIDKATVEIGGDLKKSLVAWPTSALPGSWGNNIIFGHSELPQFATPTNYSGIFTHIMDLEQGDEIIINYDDVKYVYKVIDKKVIEPTDISVLEQRYDSAYVTLITCVPPGTLWKRGVIKAQIEKF